MIRILLTALVALTLLTTSALAATEFVSPPTSLNPIHQLEYRIGMMAGASRLCGYYSGATLITQVMERSKYFRAGRDKVVRYDRWQGCGDVVKFTTQFEKDKDNWINFMTVNYPKVD